MSVLIAYLSIGFVMAAGLFTDRFEDISFNPDSLADWVALVVSFCLTVVGWPVFIRAENMQEIQK